MPEITRARESDRPPWRTIYFRLEASDAGQVSVVGDFNDWNPERHRLHRNPNGVWECQVPLPAGRYAYAFVVDGVTRPDPLCARQEATAGGESRCIIEVSPPPEG
jgi:1,4-alpha-glucan branching enzyme